jgi:hypothetical protein
MLSKGNFLHPRKRKEERGRRKEERRRESGEKLETKSIVHRALAKIEFAGKAKLPDARIACREIGWNEKEKEI